jgi:hypothetical protein
MALPSRMYLCRGVLWLTLNLALIIQYLSRSIAIPLTGRPIG